MPTKTKIDKAWEWLFEQYNILQQVSNEGCFRISSRQINQIHEARLMAKFDQSSILPKVFSTNHLSILPITRGDYLIGPFITHKEIEYHTTTRRTKVEIPPLETLDAKNLYSEAAVLHYAFHSGIIKDIMGNPEVRFTVNGRMSSGKFNFYIENVNNINKPVSIAVENAQIEIDAGFESSDKFMICEVKNQAPSDLLIRQLYYPYRLWQKKISKPVVPVFLVFSNDIFRTFVYEFTDSLNYNSIKLIDYREYSFADEDISLQDICELWRSTTITEEPSIPFPQANSFHRILDLLAILYEEELTRSEVTLKYEFDPRQTNYYVSACEYLGLVERFSTNTRERGYRLTYEGQTIMSSPYKAKHLSLMRKVFEHRIFHEAFEFVIKQNELPCDQSIRDMVQSADLSRQINPTTIGRRSSTVSAWLKWMIDIACTE